ncbi:MAG: two-component system LytT family sensor kinase [Saprospiraceae bacterium]|jgi:sensor histidine kinase YesM
MSLQFRNIWSIFSKSFWESTLKKDISYHIFFWVSLYVILVVLDTKGSFVLILVKEFINVAFFAMMVYINIYFLFPNYLLKKNLLHHLLSLAITALLITPIKTLCLLLVATDFGDFQAYLLQHRVDFFVSTFFIGIASTIYSIMNDWLASQREKKELQSQTLQSELKFLKSQINPHFLFNTLNSLYALTLKKSDQAPEIVLKLSEMMRYMLYECNEREVPLSKEINYLKNYLELEKIRQGKKMDINFIMDGEVNNQKIAPLMFIPFIENSFKHGISNQLTAGYVNILLEIEKQEVNITIENSKTASMPAPSGKKSGGIGLVNVRRRLDLLYPNLYELNIDEDPNTYTVKLCINLDK